MAHLCLCVNELSASSIGKVECAVAERLDKLVFAWSKLRVCHIKPRCQIALLYLLCLWVPLN